MKIKAHWVLLVMIIFVGCGKDCPTAPSDAREFHIKASRTETSTIHLSMGQAVHIMASGEWYDGIHTSGPNGAEGLCLGCPLPGFGSPGALVGWIGTRDTVFLVGSNLTFVTQASGVLYLAMNDNYVGTCRGTQGSCYSDNTGEVCVKIW